MSFKIGNVEIRGKVILAPMAGITSSGYRRFMSCFGIDLFYTEMISDCGVIYKNKETLSYLDLDKKERPIAIQLFGGSEDTLKRAIEIIQSNMDNYDFIDLNLACPVRKIVKEKAGSYWLKYPLKLEKAIHQIVQISRKPVTAKIRLGFDDNNVNFLEIITRLQKAGISAIAIHARTAKQMYSGKADYELLKDLKTKMSVPLIISGDINSLDDAIKAMEITKADGVMIARGGVGNPRLITQINEYYRNNKRVPDATIVEQKKYCYQLAKELCHEKGEHIAMRIMRGIAPKFFNGFPNCKEYKMKMTQELSTLKDLKSIFKKIPN